MNKGDPPTHHGKDDVGGRVAGLRPYGGWWIVQASIWDGCLQCEDGPQHAPLMLRLVVGSYIDDVHTAQLGKGFSMSSGVKKKTAEKEIAPRPCPTEQGGVAKGMVASAAGESDFVGAFSKEDLSSIDLKQQLIH